MKRKADGCSGISKTMPYVKCRAESLKEKGQEDSAAFATAWSIACKYKRDQLEDAEEHCQRPSGGYFTKKKGENMKKKTSSDLGDWYEVSPPVGDYLEGIVNHLSDLRKKLGSFSDLIQSELDKAEREYDAISEKVILAEEKRRGVEFIKDNRTTDTGMFAKLRDDDQDWFNEETSYRGAKEWHAANKRFRWIDNFAAEMASRGSNRENPLQKVVGEAEEDIRNWIHSSSSWYEGYHQRLASTGEEMTLASTGEEMTLRNQLIRLAHRNPELREDILPLLKKKGGQSDGTKILNNIISALRNYNVDLEWSDLYPHFWKDLSNGIQQARDETGYEMSDAMEELPEEVALAFYKGNTRHIMPEIARHIDRQVKHYHKAIFQSGQDPQMKGMWLKYKSASTLKKAHKELKISKGNTNLVIQLQKEWRSKPSSGNGFRDDLIQAQFFVYGGGIIPDGSGTKGMLNGQEVFAILTASEHINGDMYYEVDRRYNGLRGNKMLPDFLMEIQRVIDNKFF